ncbi:SAM-dependent methyltransferase [hydrothermal vent metagenome]|uniref:SAM-dependent methyltransferase n=1 Tax=hydrothermal vent metagenome TaxID=652676 RepID=A0A1W1CJF7_9ZZZZ
MYNEALRGEKELKLCEDGTHTLYSKEFEEYYHSTKDGALHESLEKHVKPAFSFQKHKKKLVILDICFGLGYNTFSTLYYIQKHQLDIYIHILSPEFDEALLRSLASFIYPPEFDSLKPMIKAISENLFYEDEKCKIEILLGDARKSIPKIKEKIDIVYQDAFSPTQNPLLWTKEHFESIWAIVNEDVILTTYSISASVRLGLYENGFYIFIHSAFLMRDSTVASLCMLENIDSIDMELKKMRNPKAKSLKDDAFLLTK